MAGNGHGNKAVVAALLANTGIAITKFVAFLLSGASSMLAEAIHSVADAGNQLLLLVGSKRAQREATPEHPFGFGRERYVYSFIVAIVLFSVGGLFALFEAYEKWHEVHEGTEDPLLSSAYWWVPIAVLGVSIVMEAFSFRTAIHESNKVREGRGWVEFVRRAKAPELPVILLEDLAALLGLAFALVGITMTLVTENGYWDVLGAAAIGTLLVVVAITLAIQTKSLLLGEAADPRSVAAIRSAIEGTHGVSEVIHLKTLHIGPEEVLVAAKIGVESDDTAGSVAATIDAAERGIREAEPAAQQIYIEPDIYRADFVADERPEPPEAPGH